MYLDDVIDLMSEIYIYIFAFRYIHHDKRYAMTHVQVLYGGWKEYIASDEAVYIYYTRVYNASLSGIFR